MAIERETWYDVSEDVRTYEYAGGVKVKLLDVLRFRVSEGGRHYIQTTNGDYHIMQKGWKAIHIEGPALLAVS